MAPHSRMLTKTRSPDADGGDVCGPDRFAGSNAPAVVTVAGTR